MFIERVTIAFSIHTTDYLFWVNEMTFVENSIANKNNERLTDIYRTYAFDSRAKCQWQTVPTNNFSMRN